MNWISFWLLNKAENVLVQIYQTISFVCQVLKVQSLHLMVQQSAQFDIYKQQLHYVGVIPEYGPKTEIQLLTEA